MPKQRIPRNKKYNPLEHSVVQALIRNEPTQTYEATDFHEALLFGIAREIGRVHSNRYQTSWDRWSDDPHIPGIQWRRYAYDCDCPNEKDSFVPSHLDSCPLCQPNFSFGGVSFNWYKNPGRGMSVNVLWSPRKWSAWLDRCLSKIREFDIRSLPTHRPLQPMPSASHCYEASILWMAWGREKEHEILLIDLENRILQGESELNANKVDECWARIPPILPANKEQKLSILRAIVFGITAEKMRSQREDILKVYR